MFTGLFELIAVIYIYGKFTATSHLLKTVYGIFPFLNLCIKYTDRYLHSILFFSDLGIHRFSEDIFMMIGRKPNIFFKATWIFITPALIIVIKLCILSKNILPNEIKYPNFREKPKMLVH